ncbi:Adenine phosphoribosyltransferase 1 [Citrus sinensis]|uniref:adenine phosphoribosyltransferase n=1 Tax=Citrus clementina TaxID=85681 RepID=V4T249_CITCL|nr:hypothetical protein CICLE_v10002564mg [Citrus x clementina]KAH9669021.1 Adenine phosphoribosyltransferase 1 [Citrus sinensis]
MAFKCYICSLTKHFSSLSHNRNPRIKIDQKSHHSATVQTIILNWTPISHRFSVSLSFRHKLFSEPSPSVRFLQGIKARGFIFGPPIAWAIGAKFVPMRKPKKLPGEIISEEYSLEYGKYVMEMHVCAVQAGERALIVDDLVAIGGTLSAAIRLLGSMQNHIFILIYIQMLNACFSSYILLFSYSCCFCCRNVQR